MPYLQKLRPNFTTELLLAREEVITPICLSEAKGTEQGLSVGITGKGSFPMGTRLQQRERNGNRGGHNRTLGS